MAPPLSAFAARKVVANATLPLATSPEVPSNNSGAVWESDQDDIRDEEDRRSRKRRRTLETARPLNRTVEQEHHETSSTHDSVSIIPTRTNVSPVADAKTIRNISPGADPEQDSADSWNVNPRSASTHQVCTFSPSQSNVVAETKTDWTICLASEDSLALIGQYDLWVRKGVVSLCGAVLSASSKLHRVYAPATYALPIITPVANPYGCGGERAEIRIISCNSRVRILKDLSPEYGRLWNKTVNESTSKFATQRRSYALIRTPADDPYWRPLYKFGLPSDWQESVQTFSQYRSQNPPVILVCGPKSSGKSTFCRTLTNAILTRRENQPSSDPWGRPQKATVALLDIDPGQPEFSLPGQLLLVKLQACNLGPPFVHPVINDERGRIIQLQSYGSISPKDDPPHYLDCVLKLYQSYRDLLHSHRDLPLVVNCSGWLQGGGLERQVQLIQLFEPSDVVYISDGGGQEDVIGSLAAACSTKTANFHTLSSVPLRFNLRTAAELRVMQTLSYFHLADPEAGELRWSHKPLHEVAPFVVQYSGPQQCVFAVMILGDEQDPRFFETVLSGCLVDLVLVDDDAALPKGNERTIGGELQTSHGKSGTPEYLQHPCILRSPTSIPYIPAKNRAVRPLSPKYTQCLGQALIRSIDTKNHQFHLLMPEHFVLPRLRQLEKPKIVLVRGKLETPVWAYKEPFELDKARRRRREEHLRVKEEEGADELMNNWKGTPWASVSEGKRSAGGRKRSGRRDLKYRSQS